MKLNEQDGVMTLTLKRPDDWHLHLRDGAVLESVVPHSARQFGRAIIMPNLKPPVTTTAMALAYRERILAAVPDDCDFAPLMTLYLTDTTTVAEIATAKASGLVHALKLYPAGATTNSAAGVTDILKADPVLAAMTKAGLPLLVHGEVTDPSIDIFDREAVFIETVLRPVLERHPDLKVVLEHVTTRQGVDFVRSAGANVAGTITAHHLLWNRNAIFQGGLNPHAYCLPVLKREAHREALVSAATSGEASFFLGTDSAPHPQHAKESGCGCAGIYTAHAALELYATAFAAVGKLANLEAFASLNGPAFYGLEASETTVTLDEAAWTVPESYGLGEGRVVPMFAGQELLWKLKN
ncbi:MAG: dihydroorotase [Candidatus Krumholzibacteria bacterium]|nr:dihydroorotase [Candidatus Krumholzibacteria bacterium]